MATSSYAAQLASCSLCTCRLAATPCRVSTTHLSSQQTGKALLVLQICLQHQEGQPEGWQAHTCARCCRSRVKASKQARHGLSCASARGADADLGSWKTEGNRRSRPMSRTALAGSCPAGLRSIKRLLARRAWTGTACCPAQSVLSLVLLMYSSVNSSAAQTDSRWQGREERFLQIEVQPSHPSCTLRCCLQV